MPAGHLLSAKKVISTDLKIICNYSDFVIWNKALSPFNSQNGQITKFCSGQAFL